MVRVLCTSYLVPTAKSGVTTYYKKLGEKFWNDTEIELTIVTIANSPLFWKRMAGLTRKLICLFSFGNKAVIKYAYDCKYKMMIYFALIPYKKQRFDLIHAQDILSGDVANKVFKFRLPLILTCHFNDSPVEEDILKYSFPESERPFLADKYRSKFSQVKEFIFVSEYAFEKARYLLNDKQGVRIIRNGSEFDDSNRSPKENTLNKKSYSILNVGYIDNRKNQKILLQFAKELIDHDFMDFIITLVGDGPDLNQIKQLVAEENLNPYFRFTGWAKDAQKYFKEADLLIHTAINDNCPYAVIEAISKKVPALGFEVGGMPEILDRKWLFPLNDFAGLASFTRSHIHQLPEIAVQQFERIKTSFSADTQFRQVRSVYKKIAYAKIQKA
jgi:glycosyltransferase involved in cell wall biosynthesis